MELILLPLLSLIYVWVCGYTRVCAHTIAHIHTLSDRHKHTEVEEHFSREIEIKPRACPNFSIYVKKLKVSLELFLFTLTNFMFFHYSNFEALLINSTGSPNSLPYYFEG